MKPLPPAPKARSLACAALCVGLLAACARGDAGRTTEAPQPGGPDAATASAETPAAGTGQAARQITLYFLAPSGRLSPERRSISPEGTPDTQARRVIEELLKGPSGSLSKVLPLGTSLRAIYLRPDGTAYVDFDAGFSRGLSGGSEDGLTAIWSVTDTLAANFPEVTRVKILVEGEEVLDLGGHLDLSRPLVPDMSLIEGASAGQGPEV